MANKYPSGDGLPGRAWCKLFSMLRGLAANAPRWAVALFLSLPACSVLVDLDGDDVRPYEPPSEVTGGAAAGASSGGAEPSGGTAPTTGGTSPTGGASPTGGNEGTGGISFDPVELPLELHYWRLDETAGGTVQDSGYKQLHGSAVQVDDWSPGSGVSGTGAFEVKRTGVNYIQQVNSVLPTSQTFSLSWWVSPTEMDPTGPGTRFLVSKQGGNTEGGFVLIQTTAGMELTTGGDGSVNTYEIEDDLPDDGGWSHLVLTYRLNPFGVDDRLSFYLNGKRVLFEAEDDISASDKDPYNVTQLLRFGAVEGNRHPMYSGLLDEIRLYEVELSEEEVRTLYHFDLGEIPEPDYYDPRTQ